MIVVVIQPAVFPVYSSILLQGTTHSVSTLENTFTMSCLLFWQNAERTQPHTIKVFTVFLLVSFSSFPEKFYLLFHFRNYTNLFVFMHYSFSQPYSCLLLTDKSAQEFPPPPPELLNGNHSKQLSEASILSEASTPKHRKTPSVESLDALPTGTDTCCQDVTDSLSNLSLLSGKCCLTLL